MKRIKAFLAHKKIVRKQSYRLPQKYKAFDRITDDMEKDIFRYRVW